ncbi:hypothetical protein TAMA11512_22200 [Selenomonas sp. TAMA-11512]|uniref:phosphotransferase n=1 Tax=Selenomonas sp. TAMA-11512 TaxID=3095337 RepID=UPI003085171C|nr:hypothetical protein TAMA11512_22200 [Selenomonas sp. TAMA-11512]
MPEDMCTVLMNRILPSEKVLAVTPMKKGLTNDSFRVETNGGDYVLRLNGIGTEELVNRSAEEVTYAVIGAHGFGETLLKISAREGYKLTKYMPDIRNVNPADWKDVGLALGELRRLHEAGLSVPHKYDVFDEIYRYEQLVRKTDMSYDRTLSASICDLRDFLKAQEKPFVLTHIDAIPDNFLLDAENHVTLIDWEYAAMADPDWDLAMFAIYSGYKEREVKQLIALYMRQSENDVEEAFLHKIYAMMAAAGYLWGVWCTYKHSMGVMFREYEKKQYAYARKYSEKVRAYVEESHV